MNDQLTLLDLAAMGGYTPVELTYGGLGRWYYCTHCALLLASYIEPGAYEVYGVTLTDQTLFCTACARQMWLSSTTTEVPT